MSNTFLFHLLNTIWSLSAVYFIEGASITFINYAQKNDEFGLGLKLGQYFEGSSSAQYQKLGTRQIQFYNLNS